MRALAVAVAIALMVAPAHAQGKRGGKRHSPDQMSAQKKPDDGEYKKALGRIPDQKPADPWKGVR